MTKLGPPLTLVTDRVTEYINQDMTSLCSLFNMNHTPQIHTPQIQIAFLVCLQNHPPNWSY